MTNSEKLMQQAVQLEYYIKIFNKIQQNLNCLTEIYKILESINHDRRTI